MPVIQFRRSAPRSTGDVPATGYFRFVPTADRAVPGTPDTVIRPVPFTAKLVGGAIDVDLAPTGPGWAWSVLESIDGIRDETYYVLVPDAPGPLDDPDLTRVNPASLGPLRAPEAAWWAVANSTITDASIVGGKLILTRHDGGTVDAGAVLASEADLAAAVQAAKPAGAGYIFADTDGRPYFT